ILACESSETASLGENEELSISETENIEEPTPTIQADTPTPKFTSTPSPIDNAVVTANLCNLRAGPGVNYSVVGSVEKDDVVPIFGRNENSDWLLIDYGQSIWIAASLVKLNKDMSAIDIVDFASLSNPDSDYSYGEPNQELPDIEDVEAALTCDTIYGQHKDLTDIQWREYVNIITGKPIDYTGSIKEVNTNGSIEIYACGYFDNVTFTVYGIPADVALTLEKSADVSGSGTISQVYRKNVLYKGLFSTSLKEWLFINVYGTLEVVD
ncbi:MAG: SH3 domain-containing protein, partial [Bacteroidales bacterium]